MFNDNRTVLPIISALIFLEEKLFSQGHTDNKEDTVNKGMQRLKEIHQVHSAERKLFNNSVDDENV